MSETARSKLCPKLRGEIIEWLDADQFVVLCGSREIIGHKNYWWTYSSN